MKDLRIIFMGTPEFAVTILEGLLANDYNIVGVITAPDRPAGRGQKVRKSAVKVCAETHDLTILQPTNLKSEDFQTALEALKPNLHIVVAFRMLPKSVWGLPAYGTFNLHASLLPQYRGAAPINWALINGDTETGVTTFFIDEKIDTGAVILQKTLAIDPTENAGSLHDRLMYAGNELVLETVDAIAAGEVSTTVQPQTKELKTAYKLHNENTKIDWEASRSQIFNHIRGLSPYPGSWCMLINGKKEERIKIYGATIPEEGEIETQKGEVGSIYIQAGHLYILTLDGYLELTEIQLPGKRKMEVSALLNGYKFHENCKMR